MRGNNIISNIDKNDVLKDEIFSYKILKDNKIFIYWHGKQVMILKEKQSEKFLKKIQNADAFEAQLIMAKMTDNFKHENERNNKNKKKYIC